MDAKQAQIWHKKRGHPGIASSLATETSPQQQARSWLANHTHPLTLTHLQGPLSTLETGMLVKRQEPRIVASLQSDCPVWLEGMTEQQEYITLHRGCVVKIRRSEFTSGAPPALATLSLGGAAMGGLLGTVMTFVAVPLFDLGASATGEMSELSSLLPYVGGSTILFGFLLALILLYVLKRPTDEAVVRKAYDRPDPLFWALENYSDPSFKPKGMKGLMKWASIKGAKQLVNTEEVVMLKANRRYLLYSRAQDEVEVTTKRDLAGLLVREYGDSEAVASFEARAPLGSFS